MYSHNDHCCAPNYFGDIKTSLRYEGPMTFTELSVDVGLRRAKNNEAHCPQKLRENLYYLRDKGEVTDPDRDWKWHLAKASS